MAHPLVDQLRFTRGEWLRALDGVPEADGVRRLLTRLQGLTPVPEAAELAATGGPASTPPLGAAMAAWHTVTSAADPALDSLDTTALQQWMPNAPTPRLVGTTIQRVTYHYWSHIGEIIAIRQILGHAGVPEFVGDLDGLAPYRAHPA